MVNVDLGKGQVILLGVLVRQLREDGSNGAAGWTPVRIKVDDYIGSRLEQGVELARGGDLVNIARGLRNWAAVLQKGLFKFV